MKNFIFFLLFFITISNYAQYKNTTIHFRDGSVQKGISKFAFLSGSLKFKKNKKQKKAKTLTHKEVDRFTVYNKEEKTEYQYKIVNGSSSIKLLKVKKRGNVDLFYEVRTNNAAPMPAGGGMGLSIGLSTSTEVYYIAKKDSPFVDKLFGLLGPSKKRFKKASKKLFSDCAALMQLINTKKFKKGDILEVVDFYNNKCNKTSN